MRKPTVDYSGFRLSKLNDPRFSHLKLLAGWIGYFLMYFLTEQLIPLDRCVEVHCYLDDIIPFNEYFLIAYVGWYFLIIWSLLYFMLYNVENFKRLQIFIIVTQVVATFFYIITPSCQNLRPEVFPRDNFLTDCVKLLYSADTNTGVCPSLHCAYSIGIASVWLKEKESSIYTRIFVVIFCTLVCLSTVFVKQHSAVDFFAAIPVCILAEIIACGSWWKKKFKKA